MTLVLTQQAETTIPINVQGITPCQLLGNSNQQIARFPIWHGRKKLELGEFFQVSGALDESMTIIWDGNLRPVHWIGSGMTGGKIRIESDAGRHIGSQMSGGEIFVNGDVSDFLGVEMTGGQIRVAGNAGDGVGGNYPGSKTGMNRGSILVDGDAGKGTGQSMRRGTIAIGGNVGELAGWNMLAGTIVVLGSCGANPGAGMTRGTIVLGGDQNQALLPTFRPGGTYPVPILRMLSRWLAPKDSRLDSTILESRFQQFDGDLLCGGRGEIFVRV